MEKYKKIRQTVHIKELSDITEKEKTDFNFELTINKGKLEITHELPGLGYTDEKQLEKEFKR